MPGIVLRSATVPPTSGRDAKALRFEPRVEISVDEPLMRVESQSMREVSPLGKLEGDGGVKDGTVTPEQMPPVSVMVRLNGVERLAGPATRTYQYPNVFQVLRVIDCTVEFGTAEAASRLA
jgi:hypothetical protein